MAHIEKAKKKVGTRKNIIRKLRNSKWDRPIIQQESGGKSYGTDTVDYGRKASTQWTSRRCATPEIAEQFYPTLNSLC